MSAKNNLLNKHYPKSAALLILLLFFVSSASAQVLTVTTNNDSGAGSLREAINNSVNGSIIRFSPILLTSGSNSIVLDSTINITKSITIIGLYNSNDTLSISGNNQTRIFTARSVQYLILDSLNLINGHTATDGGAILFDKGDTLYVRNSQIRNCHADNLGGGICLSKIGAASLPNIFCSLYHSQLTNNSANGDGGGIYINTTNAATNTVSKTEIIQSELTGNTSQMNGGGIYSLSKCGSQAKALSDIRVIQSNISNNSAVYDGGGINSYPQSYTAPQVGNTESDMKSKVHIDHSSINHNTSGNRGGGISSYAYTLGSSGPSSDHDSLEVIIESSEVIGNTSYQEGGGIRSHSYNSIHTISNSIISDNESLNSYGGGISSTPRHGAEVVSFHPSYSKITIDNSTISANSAHGHGAGIYSSMFYYSTNIYHVYSIVNVSNSKIFGNISTNWGDGGGIYSHARFSTVNMDNCEVYDNSARNGGGVFTLTENPSAVSHTTINRSTFYDNSAYWSGGGLSSTAATCNVNINHSTFMNNSALDKGGAMTCSYNASSAYYGSFLTILNSTIVQNTAGNNQYAVYTTANEPVIKGSIVAMNTPGNASCSDCAIQGIPLIESLGYNIFSDSTLLGSHPTDYLDIDSSTLNLDQLGYNGGNTKTAMPLPPSIALNNGDPSDLTNAQNVPIAGTREIGAAEFCQETYALHEIEACDSLTWVNGITYYTSVNSVVDTIVNAAGCDSIVTLNLVIHHPDNVTDIRIACDSFTWSNGITYYESITNVTDTLTNQSGCDSIVTLNLTIVNQSIDHQEACDSLTWIDGITYYVSTQSPTWVLTSSLGCDSTVTLDLTIKSSTSGTAIITACDSYTWIDGIEYTTSNDTATFLLTNSSGCDSLVTLNLTITHSNTGTDVVTACNSFTWIDGIEYTTSNNTATFTLENAAGCDSVVTLNLTIAHPDSGTAVVSACDSYTWIDGITYTSSTTTPTYLLTNNLGCDSVVTLDLTIHTVSDITTSTTDLTITATNSSAAYVWLNCNTNSPIAGETAQSFTANSNGSYAVQLTENGCVDTSACVIITNVGVNEINLSDGIFVSPNPTTEKVKVNLSNHFEEVFIQLFDLNGQVFLSQKLGAVSEFTVDLPGPVGIYIMEITSKDQITRVKLVKQ